MVKKKTIQRNWEFLLALGVFFIILGTLGLWSVVALTLVSILFLGVIFLVAGGAQVVDVIKSRHWQGCLWHALISVLYLCMGCLILYDPILASELITALIAWILIIMGVTRCILAITVRAQNGWGWILFAGITAFVLGLLILLQWPFSALWLIGLFIAIELIVNGWSYIFLALAWRKGA